MLVVMLRGRWWIGSRLAQCGHSPTFPLDEPFCACKFTMPHICWFSESINGTYGMQRGQELWIVHQSIFWCCVSLIPAGLGIWLFCRRSNRLEGVVGVLSCAYLAVGLLPDTLPQPLKLLHYGAAFVALSAGFVAQFKTPRPGAWLTLPMYLVYYVGLSELLVIDGVERSVVYDWFAQDEYPFPVIVMEWAFIFGATTVAMAYCFTMHIKQVVKQYSNCWHCGV